MPRCPETHTLSRWLEEKLSPSRRVEVGEHIEGCDYCLQVLEGLAARGDLPRYGMQVDRPVPGPETLEMLIRMAGHPAVAGDGKYDVESLAPPDVPGLEDWEMVGKGGMGIVFRAREVALDRPVAVKILAPGGRLFPTARVRAVRESLMMASLRHPNVVQVYRTGEVDGQPFLMMEWVDGGTLKERIRTCYLSPREAAETVRDLARAVAEAHVMNIIHRDLKPDNVLLSPSGRPGLGFVPKLTDFGLARRSATRDLTETGIALGTPGYMAPEQAGLGRGFAEVGPASDIHGLGAILFACLAGRPPYLGETPWETLVQASQGDPPSVREWRPDVSHDLATVIAKCLQRSPSRRYHSAGELADDLDNFLEGRPILARPISIPERGWKWARRRPTLAASAALLVAAVIAAIAGTAFHVASIDRALQDLAVEQGKTRDALATATVARDQATEARNKSRQALASLSDDVVERIMKRGAALNDDDRSFLAKVRTYYLEWPLEPDPEVALKFRGAGLDRLGTIFRQIHQDDESKRCHEASLAAFDEAIRRGYGGPELIEARLLAMYRLHQILGAMDQSAAAESITRRWIGILEPLARGSTPHQVRLAAAYMNLGDDLANQRRHAEADAAFRGGIGRLEHLTSDHPNDSKILTILLRSYFNAAIRAERTAREIELLQKLVDRCEAELIRFPQHKEIKRIATLGLNGLASKIYQDRPEEALALNHRRLKLARDLVAQEPGNTAYCGDVISGVAFSYQICERLGRPLDVEVELEQVVREGTRMIATEPAIFDPVLMTMLALQSQSKLFEVSGRPRRAVEKLDELVAILGPWSKAGHQAAGVISDLSNAHLKSAELLSKLGDHPAAARRLALAVDLCEPEARGRVQLKLAVALLAAGDDAGAKAAAEKVIEGGDALEAKRFLNSLATQPSGR